jgi:hypothetical protein
MTIPQQNCTPIVAHTMSLQLLTQLFFNWQWFRQLTLYCIIIVIVVIVVVVIIIIIIIRVKVHAFYAEITSYFYYWYS